MYNELGISNETVELINESEKECLNEFEKIDELCNYNSLKVLNAFHKNHVSESCFNQTTGYGYAVGFPNALFCTFLKRKILENT